MANRPGEATRFQIGNPGGPGRPKKRPISESIDDMIRAAAPNDIVKALARYGLKPGASWADVFATCLAREVLKGNVQALKEAADRTEGKPQQRIELTAREERNIEIAVVFEGPVPERTLPAPPIADAVIDVEPVAQPAENEEDHKPAENDKEDHK